MESQRDSVYLQMITIKFKYNQDAKNYILWKWN
jgi:hypothetical protein